MDQTELDILLGVTVSPSGKTDVERLRSRVAKRRGRAILPSDTAPPPTPVVSKDRRPSDNVRSPSQPIRTTRSRPYEPIGESQPYGQFSPSSSLNGPSISELSQRGHHPKQAEGGGSIRTADRAGIKQNDFAGPPDTGGAAERMLESMLLSLRAMTVDPVTVTSHRDSGSDRPEDGGHAAPADLAKTKAGSLVGDVSSILDGRARRRIKIVTVKSRIPGSRRRRIGYRVVHRRAPIGGYAADVEEGAETDEASVEPVSEPPTLFQKQLQTAFSRGALSHVESIARTDNTLGNHLPSQFRDIFTALSDLSISVGIANHLRAQLDLPSLSMRTDRVALRRAVAQMRLALYTDLVAALVLPHAPQPTPVTDDEDEKANVEKISLTPSSLKAMAQTLPNLFPKEKYAIKRFLANDDAPYGERKGKVVWTQGIGKLVGGDPMGPGFRGRTSNEGSVHVFVDHSNVLFGLMNHIHKLDTRDLPPRHLRTLSLPVLSLLLRRGRFTPHGTLHLVASSPLHQNLDPLVRLGWEVSILKRVEVYEDEVLDSSASKMVAKPQQQSDLAKQGLLVGGGGLRRYREQGVDEILHLKLLQALNSSHTPTAESSTIVLATGDAKGGQFNRDGFLGAVREAIKRGWAVELWSFSEGLSHTWRDVKRKEKWDGKFTIRLFDDWASQMVEVGGSH